MPGLALVGGGSLEGVELPHGEWMAVDRHEGGGYVQPHLVDHHRTMAALREAGCERVLAIGSVGSLREDLGPGALVAPHDFIALAQGPSSFRDARSHFVPGFDPAWRRRVLEAWEATAGSSPRDGGVYWQAPGPRLETPAEIGLISPHADVIGMTIGSECVAACEAGLSYAAVCIVDNLASGLGGHELTLAEIEAHRREHRSRLASALASVLPALAEACAEARTTEREAGGEHGLGRERQGAREPERGWGS